MQMSRFIFQRGYDFHLQIKTEKYIKMNSVIKTWKNGESQFISPTDFCLTTIKSLEALDSYFI